MSDGGNGSNKVIGVILILFGLFLTPVGIGIILLIWGAILLGK